MVSQYSNAVQSLEQLDAAVVPLWRDLERRALVPNVFLSPRFILPLRQYLEKPSSIDVLLSFSSTAGQEQLIGLALLERGRDVQSLFLPHARFLCTKYSFLGCTLLDSVDTRRAAAGLVAAMRQRVPLSQLTFFKTMSAAEVGLWREVTASDPTMSCSATERTRPILVPREAGEDYLKAILSKSRYKDLGRVRRRLDGRGKVSWSLVRQQELIPEAAETFLQLEHMGWKGERGSSLLSRPRRASFFRQMLLNFAADSEAFVCELRCGTQIVASSVNLSSGKAGYAFKIAWHPAFAEASPGVLNEVETIRHAPEQLSDLDTIDSCTGDDSFIDRLWSARRHLFDGVLVLGAVGTGVHGAVRVLRSVRAGLRRLRPSAVPKPDAPGSG